MKTDFKVEAKGARASILIFNPSTSNPSLGHFDTPSENEWE
jgi:hypothetical protein